MNDAAVCVCGHSHRQHEIRSGGLLGCYISGCLCIDYRGGCPAGGEHTFREHDESPRGPSRVVHCTECDATP